MAATVLGEGGLPPGRLEPQSELKLVRDLGQERYWLMDPRTGESVQLTSPPAGETWSLRWCEHRFGIVESESEMHWANSFLSYDIHVAGDQRVVVLRQTNQRWWYDDLVKQNLEMSYRLEMEMCPADCRVAVFLRPQFGAHCWFSIVSFYDAMRLTLQTNAPRWIASRAKSWGKLLASLGLVEVHLRPGIYARSSGDGTSSDNRALTYPSASSHAAVAVLANLAAGVKNYGGLLVSRDIMACTELLRSLLAKLHDFDTKLRVNADMDSLWVWEATAGRYPLLLPMARCVVDLRPLRQAMSDRAHPMYIAMSVCRASFGDILEQDFIELHMLLIGCLRLGPPFYWFTKQLVYAVGSLLDICVRQRAAAAYPEVLLAPRTPSSPAPTASSLAPSTSRRAGSDISLYEEDGSVHSRQQRLQRYFFVGRSVFEDAGCISLAVDASRVSKQAVTLVAICRPDNQAMWAPPQALRAPLQPPPSPGLAPKSDPQNTRPGAHAWGNVSSETPRM